MQNATPRQFPARALPGSFSHTPEDWHRTDSLSRAWSCWRSLPDTPADISDSATKLFEVNR